MIGTKRLRQQYDRIAKQYMNILTFAIRTNYGVCLVRLEKVMENLDKQLNMIGEL